MKKLLLIALLLIGVGVGVGLYLFNKKVPSLENTEAAYTLTADQLFNEFEADESAAQTKYVDQVLEVSGTIARTKSTDSISSIVLIAKNAMMGGVNCSFNGPITDFADGTQIVIKGRCQGYLMDVVLNNCVIVE
ncbi:MAG: hypothetical protein CMP59_08290 [Flavobacteriales bacterium]|nr:hypothetical protein [Flavobacteriales bacterium]